MSDCAPTGDRRHQNPALPWPLRTQQPYRYKSSSFLIRLHLLLHTHFSPPLLLLLYFSLERDLNNLNPPSILYLSSSAPSFLFPLAVEAQSAVQTASRLQELQVRQSWCQRSRRPLGNQKNPHISRSDSYSQVRTAFYFSSLVSRAQSLHTTISRRPSRKILSRELFGSSSLRWRADILNWERERKQHLKLYNIEPIHF